jgi:hypothetical protein
MDLKLHSTKAVKVKFTFFVVLFAFIATYASATYPNPPDKTCSASFSSARYCASTGSPIFLPTGKE